MTSQGMYSIVVGGSWNKVFVLNGRSLQGGGGNAWEGGQWPALSRRGFYFGYLALRYSGYGKERKPPEEVGNKESGRGSDKRTPYGE